MTIAEVAPAEVAEAEPDPREGLDPCRVCGNAQDAGPESTAWTALHCWKCGYRPGVATAAAIIAPTVDSAKLMAELRKGVVEDILAALKSGSVPTTTFTPATPGAPVPPVTVATAVPAVGNT